MVHYRFQAYNKSYGNFSGIMKSSTSEARFGDRRRIVVFDKSAKQSKEVKSIRDKALQFRQSQRNKSCITIIINCPYRLPLSTFVSGYFISCMNSVPVEWLLGSLKSSKPSFFKLSSKFSKTHDLPYKYICHKIKQNIPEKLFQCNVENFIEIMHRKNDITITYPINYLDLISHARAYW